MQDRIFDLIKPFRNLKSLWQVRIEASRALLDLEFQYKGVNAALSLFIEFLEEEPSLRGCNIIKSMDYTNRVVFLCDIFYFPFL